MIQSQHSFKHIISFTFASLMFKISDRNNLTSFEKFAAEKCFGLVLTDALGWRTTAAAVVHQQHLWSWVG